MTIQEPSKSPPKTNNKAHEVPGPGFYDPLTAFSNEKNAVSSSMFKSDSVRELMNIHRGPGPCFYK
jgi:hypothetical protein